MLSLHEKEYRSELDGIDRQLILLTQDGLPLTIRPYEALALELGISEEDCMFRFRNLMDKGIIRRMGVIPHHYNLGYRHNGMSVWNVPDTEIHRLGPMVGNLPAVSHCYLRPRHLPFWPYNFFAMIHGRSKEDVETTLQTIIGLLGEHNLGHQVLYSTRVLKKTGLRLRD